MGRRKEAEAMKLKLDENGAVVTLEKDGNHYPIYIDDDGKEIDVDVPNLFAKVSELSTEAKNHRQEKSVLKETLLPFEGIEDLPEWKVVADKAIETVKNYDDKQLVAANKVEQIKLQIIEVKDEEIQQVHKSYRQKMDEYDSKLLHKDGQIYELAISNKFAQSPLFSGSNRTYKIPADMAEAKFSRQIKLEEGKDGKLREVGYKLDGEPVYSRKNPGELAYFDEFMPEIIDEYPNKDDLIDATAGSGSGGGDGAGGLKGVDAEIAKLKVLYKAAMDAKDGKTAVPLKNRIFELETQRRSGSR
jgi:hypothetical protein